MSEGLQEEIDQGLNDIAACIDECMEAMPAEHGRRVERLEALFVKMFDVLLAHHNQAVAAYEKEKRETGRLRRQLAKERERFQTTGPYTDRVARFWERVLPWAMRTASEIERTGTHTPSEWITRAAYDAAGTNATLESEIQKS